MGHRIIVALVTAGSAACYGQIGDEPESAPEIALGAARSALTAGETKLERRFNAEGEVYEVLIPVVPQPAQLQLGEECGALDGSASPSRCAAFSVCLRLDERQPPRCVESPRPPRFDG